MFLNQGSLCLFAWYKGWWLVSSRLKCSIYLTCKAVNSNEIGYPAAQSIKVATIERTASIASKAFSRVISFSLVDVKKPSTCKKVFDKEMLS